MSTYNICFRGEIRKILCGYPLLSVAMVKTDQPVQIYRLISLHCTPKDALDVQADLSLGRENMQSCRKWCAPSHILLYFIRIISPS